MNKTKPENVAENSSDIETHHDSGTVVVFCDRQIQTEVYPKSLIIGWAEMICSFIRTRLRPTGSSFSGAVASR